MESLTQSPKLPDTSQYMNQQAQQQMPKQATIELKGIHLPEQINDYPTAMGWWGLAAIIIFAILISTMKFRAYIKLRVNQKYALTQMQQKPNLEQSVQILKWAAMQYFPRHQIANLYGEQFQQFLTDRLSNNLKDKFTKLSSPAFEAQYKNQTNVKQNNVKAINENLNQGIVLWLKHALPPNKLANGKNNGASQ